MKKIGLLGGMSYQSTELYYRIVNEEVNRKLGSLHSAKLVLDSVDFQEVMEMQHSGDWDAAAGVLIDSAQNIEKAGADMLLICTNTMHKVAAQVQESIQIPLLHVADATARKIQKSGFKRVGFLGTKFSMEDSFYTGRLKDQFGFEVFTPNKQDRDFIHKVIYEELCLGIVNDESRKHFLRIISDLNAQGAECIIEGCTEIVMLIQQIHTDIPLFDTTAIHAEEAVAIALSESALTRYSV